jgi:hypothetical protein
VSPSLLLPCFDGQRVHTSLMVRRSRFVLVACMILGTAWCGARSTAVRSWRGLLPDGRGELMSEKYAEYERPWRERGR